ncbi:MAG: RIO1 family regulatory kinase/ATPase domain-containing protein [Promethearchaeota archaeon]
MKALKQLQKLNYEDIRILMAVELGMKKFRMVPSNHVQFFARYNLEETQFHLDNAHKIGVLLRSRKNPIGYCLNSEGYDVLALHALFKKNIIESLGPSIGRGKESDVYRALTPLKEQVAVKLHRLGQTSFREVRKLRSYFKGRKQMSWLYASRLSAKREFEALKKINEKKIDVNVPKPLGYNRHAIVMSIIQGEEIHKFDFLNDSESHFNEIIREYKLIYSEVHIIHGDLGEFNVLLDPDDNIMIIDWPQWEDWNHPNAVKLVTRDISNICIFFKKKYDVESDPKEIIGDIFSLNPNFTDFVI